MSAKDRIARRTDLGAALLLVALAAGSPPACGRRAEPPPDESMSDARLAALETHCGAADVLAGDRIRLAASLEAAALRVRPLKLMPREAAWLLEEGWASDAAGEAGPGGIPMKEGRATIRLPAPPCAGAGRTIVPLLIAIGAPLRSGPSDAGAAVHAATTSGLEADARVGGEVPRSTIDLSGEPWRGRDLVTLSSEPAGAAILEGIALPLGRIRIEIEHDRRDSIAAASVREALFRIVPPPSAVLRLGIAVRPREAPPRADPSDAAWIFRVTVKAGGEEKEVLREEARGTEKPPHWIERSVDLSPWSGKEIALTLSAEPRGDPPPIALWGSPTVEAARGDRPNILLISVDSLRADRIGRSVAGIPLTPNLDRLASEGVRFTQARTQAPSTLYGHGTILTGLPPAAHGATPTSSLPEEIPYLPDLLGREGYATIAVTDGGLLDGRSGLARGFDRFRNRFEKIGEKVSAALAILDATAAPWFLFLHTYDVHIPYEPPAETARALSRAYAGRIGLALDARSFLRINNAVEPVTPEDVRRIESLYDAEVVHADAALGALFEELRDRNLWDRTIVVVTSDHGDEFDEHGVIGWHALTCYEEVQRVPLIIKPSRSGIAPRTVPSSVASAVRSQDIAPTLLQLAGLGVPTSLRGASLRALMEGASGPGRETLCEIEDGRGAGLVAGGWKYLMRTAESAADPRTFRRRIALRGRYPTEELYDLARDPGEQRNLASSSPDRARALRARLETRLGESRDLLTTLAGGRTPPARSPEDEERLRQLRALGYIE